MSSSTIAPEDYAFLQEYIHRESGILLDHDKHYLVTARLAPVMERSHLESLAALAKALRSPNPSLRQSVVEAMTTHETLFFRDAAPFEALKSTFLPELVQKRASSRTLRIWSAAASSGQEPYSLAITLLEAGLANWNLQILGTDLSEQILSRAREGRFMQIEMNRGMPAPLLVKYFDRDGLDWRIKEHIRKMVRFEQFDLRRSMVGKGPFDIVFCRNVLIYFDIPTKKQILAGIRGVLSPGGYLSLGGSESTLNLDESFQRVPVGKATYYRKPE